MPERNGDSFVMWAVKSVFGDVPARWVRFVLFCALIAWGGHKALGYLERMHDQAEQASIALQESTAANKAWQNASEAERVRLLAKVNARFRRLYQHNNWDYEDMETRDGQ